MINKFVNYVIRPKRITYDPQKDLGPSVFFIEGVPCGRIDFKVMNHRKQTIVCSMYHCPIDFTNKYPCVFYCHSNCGNRTDSFESLRTLLSLGIFVVCFDFPGCGLSDGEIITLGYYEHFDIDCVIQFVLEQYDFIDSNNLGLWGRSMGAVAAIYNASRNEKIKGVVLDSPFCSFPMLLKDYQNRYKLIARIAGKYIEKKMRAKIKEKANFDIHDLIPLNHVSKIKCPVTLIHGKSDSLVLIKHSRALYDAIKSEKRFLTLDLGHNDVRPEDLYSKIKQFWSTCLTREQSDSFSSNGTKIDIGNESKINSILISDVKSSNMHNADLNGQNINVPFFRIDKRKNCMVPAIKDEQENENNILGNDQNDGFESPNSQMVRAGRREKLFFVIQDKREEETEQKLDDDVNFLNSDRSSKKFESFVVNETREIPLPQVRTSKRRKIFFKFPSKRPEYVAESDAEELMQLDDVFSSIQGNSPKINKTPQKLIPENFEVKVSKMQ